MQSSWVTRREAMKILGVKAPQTVQSLCKKHKIPVKRSGGQRGDKCWYPRASILHLARVLSETLDERHKKAPADAPVEAPPSPRIDQGKIAARAFKLFSDQMPLPQVVIELEITGEEVGQLFKTWWDLNRATQEWLNPTAAPAGQAPAVPTTMPTTPTTPAPPPAPEPEVYVKPTRGKRGPQPYEAPQRNPPDPPDSPNMCDAPRADGMCCPTHFLEQRRNGSGATHS